MPTPPTQDTLSFDLACVGCGYNLRSLRRDGDCPECGRPIRDTLASFRTQWSRSSISAYKTGCILVGASGMTTAAVPVIGLGFSLSGVGYGTFGGYLSIEVIISSLMITLVLIEHALWVAGLLRLSTGHPGAKLAGPAMINTLRASAVCLAALVIVVIAMVVAALLEVMPFLDEDTFFAAMSVGILLVLCARAVGVITLAGLLGRTLAALNTPWKRRHLIVTSVVVTVLCAAQALATIPLMLDLFNVINDNDIFGLSAMVGMISILALPFIAVWAGASVFRAGVAIKHADLVGP